MEAFVFEGALNMYKMLFNKKEKSSASELHEKEAEDAQIFEQKRVKSAILIDFILSIEIIIITLGTVLDQLLLHRLSWCL